MIGKNNELYRTQKMDRAKLTINEINNLLNFGYYNNAVNRLYYASFYAAQALLSTLDIFPKSHKGILVNLSQYFIQTGKIPKLSGDFYSQLFQERQLADYADETHYTKEFVEELLSFTQIFVGQVEVLLSNNKD